MTDVSVLAGVTRTEVALHGFTAAVERVRHAEQEAEASFAQLAASQELCREVGLACEMTMGPGFAAAYSEWKQQQRRPAA